MPKETKQAVDWALSQTYINEDGEELPVTKETRGQLVSKVREYFNENDIAYNTFSYTDLQPLLN